MQIGPAEIELIVQQVVKNLGSEQAAQSTTAAPKGDWGVFDRVEDAIDAAYTAQKRYIRDFSLENRNTIVSAIRKVCNENVNEISRMVKDETRLGRYEDKIQKHLLIINKTPGPECLKTSAISGDQGLMLEEPAPFGLIGAVTPTTNPTETIINNVIGMISGGNAVVFNVHPSAKNCCAHVLKMINRAIVQAGGPQNLATMVKEPTMETCDVISGSPKVRLMVGTGGMGMVNALLRSGKKTIGAGAGNPPVIVDETADIARAAGQIFLGASFDNNLLCLAEKEVFVLDQVADQLVDGMIREGAYLLNAQQLEQVTKTCLLYDGEWHVNKKWVGQDAGLILNAIGVTDHPDCRLLICQTPHDHPFVTVEQLMPVLPIVRCPSLDKAIEWAMAAEQGNRHTASMFSQNIKNLTRFAKEVETTIFVKNAATLSGVGFNGEGFTTMTIAGPTGEGITCARSFTRQRRCVLADGGFRVI
ncbi:aldehyde dehydrogenase family protein [Oscillospiraceae bacterium PP1C4]